MIQYNDYPIKEVMETADRVIAEGGVAHQKWSCAHCGARQTMDTPNSFYATGKCEECGKISMIEKCNLMVLLPLEFKPPARPK